MSMERTADGVFSEPPNIGEVTAQPTITVHIAGGTPFGKTFYLDKLLPVRYSVWFRDFLQPEAPNKKESEVVELQHIDPSAFKTFVWWLYCQSIPDPWSNSNHSSEGGDKIIALYLLARYFGVLELREYLISILHKFFSIYELPLSTITIKGAFVRLPQSDHLYDLIIDAHCQLWDGTRLTSPEIALFNTLPSSFFHQISLRYSGLRFSSDPTSSAIKGLDKYIESSSKELKKACHNENNEISLKKLKRKF
ncbi:hypothetical protein B0J11DRAFT_579688 [Dendryphion nanum]|uniref:BTB domain-containing protein n=1 Tax=Dendryphion nanum TaxID=256645 RepID=A0A9P9ILS3_9PLEO|nr:hypothetical protein B0J11DRAFT_579688 [Dendryphion nanum]